MKSHFCADSIAGMSCFAYVSTNDETSCMDIHIGRRKLRVRHILHETNDEREKEREYPKNSAWKQNTRQLHQRYIDISFPRIVIYICNPQKLTDAPIVQYSERSKLNGFLSFAKIICNLLEMDKIFLER